MNPERNSLERSLEEAVSRALRDNLAPLQRTADELHQAYADLVASCASTRPSNALPAMLRAQTAAAALAAGLSVLSNFVAVALNPRDANGSHSGADAGLEDAPAEAALDSELEAPVDVPSRIPRETVIELTPSEKPETPLARSARVVEAEPEPVGEVVTEAEPAVALPLGGDLDPEPAPVAEAAREAAIEAAPVPMAAEEPVAAEDHIVDVPAGTRKATEIPVFDIASLPPELQDLHRRANRVAKVAMQDIKLLRPKDVESGRANNDVCDRLRVDLDKARKEYDRRFRAISDHPVDYFQHWALEILAGGDRAALGNYPYPSPLPRN